ncbi:hypothetical protein SAMN06295974_3824 [Plantibacter flavus]|uniref:Uncharacterized protein n=1 Tax=Plantibacter flavus TaxID=150123 RepID=A0A3N2BL88_9MICO|nr:hypothetical protein [Plantibacter flavus]ROR76030.1 hypothetical protein EDD42_3982 [Plantibacter flavus]SMG49142.1 hypothetical protein SAMN06295974_3824 [Plantibacter flavus]
MTLHRTLATISTVLADGDLEPLDKIQELNRITARAQADAQDNAVTMATKRPEEVLRDVVGVGALSGLPPAGFAPLVKPVIDRLPKLFDSLMAAPIDRGYFDEFQNVPGVSALEQRALLDLLARYDETIANHDALTDSEKEDVKVYERHEDTLLAFTSEFADAIRKALA